jgi:hypothetical protein
MIASGMAQCPGVSAELRRSGQYCAFGIYKENEPPENLVPRAKSLNLRDRPKSASVPLTS